MLMGSILYSDSDSRSSDLDHFKVDLGRITIGALPRIRDIFPARTWIKPVFWQTLSFIVNEAADDTHPSFVRFRSQRANSLIKATTPNARGV